MILWQSNLKTIQRLRKDLGTCHRLALVAKTYMQLCWHFWSSQPVWGCMCVWGLSGSRGWGETIFRSSMLPWRFSAPAQFPKVAPLKHCPQQKTVIGWISDSFQEIRFGAISSIHNRKIVCFKAVKLEAYILILRDRKSVGACLGLGSEGGEWLIGVMEMFQT